MSYGTNNQITMANLRFKKVSTLPTTGLQEGDILFVKSNSTVYVTEKKSATDTTLVNTPFWGGIVKNARMKKASPDAAEARVLEISYMDSTPALEIDFSDIASSLDISAKLNALSTRITAAQTRADNAYNLAAGKVSDVKGSKAIVVTGDKTKTVGLVLNTSPTNTVELTQSAPGGGGSAVTGGLSANVKVSVLKPQLDLVGTDEKVLSYDGGFVKSDITMSYDGTDKKIYLYGKDKTKAKAISTIDCKSFVKDGMLEGSALYKATAATGTVTINGKPYSLTDLTANHTYIVLIWNTDSSKEAMSIDVTTLIDVYTAGEGLTLTNNQFSVDKTKVAQKADLDKLESALVNGGVAINGYDILTKDEDTGEITGSTLTLDGGNVKVTEGYTKATESKAIAGNDAIETALGKLEYKADKAITDAAAAAKAGVTSVGGQKGDITLDSTGAGSYPIKLTMSGKQIKASVAGLGTAAAHLEGDFATKAQGKKADNSVQLLDAGDSGNINGAFGASTIYLGAKDSAAPGNLWISSTVRDNENIAVLSIDSNQASVGSSNRAISGVTAVSSDFDVTNKQYVDRKISTEISAAMTWATFE
jgi:hypothetical protein